MASLTNGETSWIDGSALPGIAYEYAVVREFASAPGRATGYLLAGYNVELLAGGRVILIVTDSVAGALEAELERWCEDLVGDGWSVIKREVSESASPQEVKAVIRAANDDGGVPARALILFGRVPVPYSGDHAPDGHIPEHRGAWPADTYYADLDGEWTDELVSVTSASRPATWNVPGDGKFDASLLPSDVELETGRIDFANMTLIDEGEIDLLKRYLDRNHAFRHRMGDYSELPRLSLIDDQFATPTKPFAANGWRNFSPMFGPASTYTGHLFSHLGDDLFLFALSVGSGSYTSMAGVGTSVDFGARRTRAVFHLLGGSYFGDWDVPNNFLRAPLAGHPDSLGLASLWIGRPDVHMFPMALGETIGYAVRLTQNNNGDVGTGYTVGEDSTARGTHIALMGDPTLRLLPVSPPDDLNSAIQLDVGVRLSWTPSKDAEVLGYSIFRKEGIGPWQNLAELVQGQDFLDTMVSPQSSYHYRVHALKHEITGSGTYLNRSQAALSTSVSLPDGFWTGPHIELRTHSDDAPIAFGSTVAASPGSEEEGLCELHFSIRSLGSHDLTIKDVVLIDGSRDWKLSPTVQERMILHPGNRIDFALSSPIASHGRGDFANEATVSVSTDDPRDGDVVFSVRGCEPKPQDYRNFDEWIEQFTSIPREIQGIDDDPDGDGISNALEYAFGGDPSSGDSGDVILPRVIRVENVTSESADLFVEYRQRGDLSGSNGRGAIGRDYAIHDLRYIVETSTDNGSSWIQAQGTAVASQLPKLEDSNAEIVTVVSRVPESTPDGFIRLARVRVVVSEPLFTFARWVKSFDGLESPVATPIADPDGDGLTNLMEYALGGDPAVPDAVSLVPKLVEFKKSGRELFLSYSRRIAQPSSLSLKGVTDLTYGIEVSDDLVHWVPWDFGSEENIVSVSGDGFEKVRVRVFDVIDGRISETRFVRVRIGLRFLPELD
ncbi:MAG: hypothetical protein KDN22_24510 [Verrucomicrobiae bacterium]|nr:hypothetical protein [Verrucomicrobiae bacterium]